MHGKKVLFFALFLASPTFGQGVGSSAGLSLGFANGARPAALGDAFSSAENDIAAFNFNPATLDLLERGHSSFLFQRGAVDDSFGQLALGLPSPVGGLGLSIGYYDGGDLFLSDGVTTREVTAQTDLAIQLGHALSIGNVSIGWAGKYFSSELAETATARSVAGDLGLSIPVGSRLRIGGALQNYGTKLKFRNKSEDIPRTARAGMSFLIIPTGFTTTFFSEFPYFVNEAEWQPAAGIETLFGPLAMRMGYKSGGDNDSEELSFGTGFILGPSAIDYAFGLGDQLDSRHRVSLSMRFGSRPSLALVKSKELKRRTVVELTDEKPDSKWTAWGSKPAPLWMRESLSDIGDQQAWTRWGTQTRPLLRRHRNIPEPSREMTETWTKWSPGQQPAFVTERVEDQINRPKKTYLIKEGDTLSDLAQKWYGDRLKWYRIYQANNHLITDPDNVTVGMKILIPARYPEEK